MIKEVEKKDIKDFDLVGDNNPFTKYIAYYDKDIMCGLLEFNHMYEKLDIVNIFVKEDYRGKKIGSLLMEELIKYGKENNCYNITLEVKRCNFSAIRLYEKYGFKKVAVREGYYNGVDGLLMELIL